MDAAYDSVSQRLLDGQMATEPTRLVHGTQFPEKELHLGRNEVAFWCHHDVGDVPRLAKRLQHQLVPEAQHVWGEGQPVCNETEFVTFTN